jgi:hypothetical protein
MVNRDLTKDHMIAYLLHEMPEGERAAFAERWFTEPDLYERLQMTEAELLDNWARGKVSRSQRRRVEQYLLGSELQQQKLAFAAALSAALPRPRVMRVPWLAVVAALLFVSLAAALWLGMQNRRLQNHVAQLERVVQPVAGVVNTDGIYTIGLTSDTLRGATAENAVRLPEGVRLLRLELELPPGAARVVYSASLLSGNRAVWSEGPLHPEGRGAASIATIWIPTETAILGPGDHTVRLEASGNPPAYYRFTIIR